MSLLVRRGTMCHRSSKRLQRRQPHSSSAKGLSSSASASGSSGSPLTLSSPGGIGRKKELSQVKSMPLLASTDATSPDTRKKGSFKRSENMKETNSLVEEIELQRKSSKSSSTSAPPAAALREQQKITAPEITSELSRRPSIHLAESGMASYGSIAYQMRDAKREAAGSCEFVYKALKVLSRTIGMTVLLILFLFVPFLMIIMGVQYLQECPLESNIPIYLLVGGCFGFLKFLWLLCRQIRSRRYEHIDDAFAEDGLEEIFSSTSYKATDVALTVFLLVWFGLGNYWVIKIYPPNFEESLWQPNDWCSKTVYIFTVVQLIFVHAVLALFVLVCFGLCCGQKCLEAFGDNYK